MTEAVNHPAHYGGKNNPYEAIKVIDAWALSFALGNTVKYISRAGHKPLTQEPTLPFDPHGQERAVLTATLQDLKKARWYLDHEIQLVEEELTRLPVPEKKMNPEEIAERMSLTKHRSSIDEGVRNVTDQTRT